MDYYARDGALASPLQHFWSLSVQGQVFVLWPLLLLGCAVAVRRFRLPATPVLLVVFGTVFVASLAFSVVETATAQDLAYFDTRTRLWEFALGSLVAVVLPFVRLPAWSAVPLGWAGLAAIVVCGLVLDVQGGFPGYYALWPTVAAGAVIVAGVTPSRFGAGRLLGHRVLGRLGRDAYALYLVHWPLLISWRLVTGRQHLSLLEGLAVVTVSLALARALTALVEDPLRNLAWARDRTGRSAVVVAVAAALVVVPLAGWQGIERSRAAHVLAASSSDHPGAGTLLPGYRPTGTPTAAAIPTATTLGDQWVSLVEPCSGRMEPSVTELAERCGQTIPLSEPARTVVVVGDSHSEQFMGALAPIAEQEDWALVSVLNGGCSFGLGEHPCREWNERVLEYVLELAPDAIFTVVTAAEADGTAESLVEGVQEMVDTLAESGISVIGLRDNPRFSFDVYLCAESNGPDADECRRDVSTVSAERNPADDLALADGSVVVDLLDVVCPDGVCSPVVGNVFVYLDDNHLTWDYTRSLTPFLEERIAGWSPARR